MGHRLGCHSHSWLVSVVALLLCLPALNAQEYRGRIQGVVTDTSGSTIPGAVVTLRNVNTGSVVTRAAGEAGHYLFDLIEPGSYDVSAEFRGFNRLAKSGVLLQSRGDVSVDFTLTPGDVQQTVTVEGAATAVQFNTSKLETTVDSELTSNLPQLYRSPFMLAQLDPSVERSDSQSEYNPYNTDGANQQRVGGGANRTNDLQVDGTSVNIGFKTGYVPSPDMVQEVSIQQNAVDAEYGHGSGSAISLTLKSGTNEWHGNIFYQGQYPWANAVENRVFNTINKGRNHMFGATLGNPIRKDHVFNFFAFEGWRKMDPGNLINTLPTDLERLGDFSQSLNTTGGLRTIYDPWSTLTSADRQTITRLAFPGNKIPESQQDPVARWYMSRLWKPNRPGDGAYFKVNNYYAPLPLRANYNNFSDRLDYDVNSRLRLSGRYSTYRTPVTAANPTGSELFLSDRGSQRDASSFGGNATWTVNDRTVLDVRVAFHDFVDASKWGSDFSEGGGWNKIWANSNFFKTVFADPGVPVLMPRMSINGPGGERFVNMGPGGVHWDYRPNGDNISVKMAQQRGRHYVKFGVDTRGSYTSCLFGLNNPGFGFTTDITSDTYVNPDPRKSGDAYASFLIGAVQSSSVAPGARDGGTTSMPMLITPTPETRGYSAFINDDWKITRNLTLNLGLRWEMEAPYRDPLNRLTRPLDLTSPIPEMQGAGAPQMPAEVKQYYTGQTVFNGAFQFADANNRGQWNSDRGALSPRIGVALRLNDRTSLRAAYGLYPTPWTSNGLNIYSSPYVGFVGYTGAPPALDGVPQMRLRDPFPASYPIPPSYGKTLGRYTGLGDSFAYVTADRPRNHSSRLNASFQRELPGGFVFDSTFYLNFTSQINVRYNVNQIDPRVAYEYKAATNKSVNNPFYNFSTVDKFPGPARYQQKVSLTSLMRKYPQYGDLNVTDAVRGSDMKYYAMQFRVQRNFAQGVSVLAGYDYHVERNQSFYDDIATFTKTWSWQDANNPRHRFNAAGTWALPVGKGQRFLASGARWVDAVAGGWNLTGILTWRSGRFLRFGAMVANGDPILENPTARQWFNTGVFSRLAAYTPRSNPWQYPGLTAPGLLNVDASLVKRFPLRERVRAEVRVDSFNALNNMTWADPTTNINSSTFGRSTDQLSNTFGRRLQLGLRLEF